MLLVAFNVALWFTSAVPWAGSTIREKKKKKGTQPLSGLVVLGTGSALVSNW